MHGTAWFLCPLGVCTSVPLLMRPLSGLQNDKYSLLLCLTLQHAVIAGR